MTRREEALRRELTNDLLRVDADVSRTAERAKPFGHDLSKARQVALKAPDGASDDIGRAAIILERAIVDRFGKRRTGSDKRQPRRGARSQDVVAGITGGARRRCEPSAPGSVRSAEA